MLPLLLASCLHHPARTNEAHPVGFAPFRLGRVVSALWMEEPRHDGAHGVAWLLLSDRALNCRQMATELHRDLVEPKSLLWTASGVLLRLEVEAPEGTDADFEGRYHTQPAEPLGEPAQPVRRLAMRAFADGAHYALTDTWGSTEVTGTEGRVRGSVDSEMLAATFAAEVCR